ncbi:hypothetical protein THAOC_17157 [Thalassiosira oceanica]|uniref:Uncharacterized protein n=1 Tax=Thalassiosira oceanica TaxID=159749 RepID=K0SBD3_THAOC|nr:hypothetical protein THAOC_17157 [Thalassiosira oceanica]|eukprot:EJK62239.1 hypothetical protein THAOC_17157 [Thalassiosira oceanica]
MQSTSSIYTGRIQISSDFHHLFGNKVRHSRETPVEATVRVHHVGVAVRPPGPGEVLRQARDYPDCGPAGILAVIPRVVHASEESYYLLHIRLPAFPVDGGVGEDDVVCGEGQSLELHDFPVLAALDPIELAPPLAEHDRRIAYDLGLPAVLDETPRAPREADEGYENLVHDRVTNEDDPPVVEVTTRQCLSDGAERAALVGHLARACDRADVVRGVEGTACVVEQHGLPGYYRRARGGVAAVEAAASGGELGYQQDEGPGQEDQDDEPSTSRVHPSPKIQILQIVVRL